jgi:hypothetical protein
LAFELGQQTHAVGDVETRAPEIDYVAACAQFGRPLDEGRRESVANEPVCEGWSCDSRAGYQDSHCQLQNTLEENWLRSSKMALRM